MIAFIRSSLSRQFLLISFPVLLTGMMVIGSLIGKQVEESVVHRMGGVTGLYVDSFVAPHVQSLLSSDDLRAADRVALSALLTQTPLGKRIVAFKIWRPDGRILYSADASLIGQSFPIGEGLAEALAGRVHSEVSELNAAENAAEAHKWPRLIETYTPIHALGLGSVIAVAEFYQRVDEVMHESAAEQRQSWLVVALTTAVMYLLLFLLVRRGSQTIDRQRRELNDKLAQLTALNTQNEQLHDRVRRAAASTTALNETFLRRIAADLHDGPGQDLGFALMRFDSISDLCSKRPGGEQERQSAATALRPIHSAIESALADLRSICAGLHLPEIDPLTLNEIAARAVRDYESKTGAKVALVVADINTAASLPVKIALYRLLQESLANGFRHAAGAAQRVEIRSEDSRLLVEISDKGPGFDPHAAVKVGHLGLVGMRERVEILGGSFDLQSMPGLGTLIRVNLPLVVPEMNYE
ncbi:sensor histidine kinase [Rhodoferax ferrireducens]|uniref:sensor histidine kinase n=1 Tax=Rhodoferax ferrireducens TaxID=192843 RepID=UPI0018E588C0|nr:sensor histidine kinase [Rhodoferax ferrireducens]